MDHNLHSVSRRLIELRMALAELNSKFDRLSAQHADELGPRRLEKQRSKLRAQIMRLESELDPPQPA